MKLPHKIISIVVCSAFSVTALAIQDTETKSGFASNVGPLCVTALLSYGVEVGRKCLPEQSAENQKKLEETQAILDGFILNDPDWNEARLIAFKKRQGGTELSKEQLCKGDALLIGKDIALADQRELQASINDVISRYDKVIWGTCL